MIINITRRELHTYANAMSIDIDIASTRLQTQTTPTISESEKEVMYITNTASDFVEHLTKCKYLMTLERLET